MCKQIYLPIDAKNKQSLQQLDTKNGTLLPNYINELSQQFRASVATSYYCIEHGLVRIPELFYCTQSELEQLEHHIIDNTLAPSDLISLRGNYHEYDIAATNASNIPMESLTTNIVPIVILNNNTLEYNTDVPTTEETVVSIGDNTGPSAMEVDNSLDKNENNNEIEMTITEVCSDSLPLQDLDTTLDNQILECNDVDGLLDN